MAVVMTLGAVNLGANFPLYSSTFELVRNNEQGEAYKRVKITLSGFIEGSNHAAVMAIYNTLRSNIKNDTTFTYTDGATTVHNNQQVWIAAYNEPEDGEYGKCAVGDYSIELYYFEDAAQTNKAITCTYGSYTFEKTPTWQRDFTVHRESGGERRGTTASVTISGLLFAANAAALKTKIDLLEAALSQDAQLTYGSFSQPLKIVNYSIGPAVPNNFIEFNFTGEYEIDGVIEMRRKVKYSRIHRHPNITEEPGCERRVIDYGNSSGQTVSYSFSVRASTIELCRETLAVELLNIVEPGGIEMPGGEEDWNLESNEVNISFTKFHSTPVLANLVNT